MEIEKLKKITSPIFYITNDASRAIGLENILPNFHIVCLDDSPLVDSLINLGISVFCLEKETGKINFIKRNSGLILSHPKVLEFINKKAKGERPNLIFFKPQKRIEIIAERQNFNLIGNTVAISQMFEDKLSFFNICKKEKIDCIDGETGLLSGYSFSGLKNKYSLPFVIQLSQGWAGNSTFFINCEEEFSELQKTKNNHEVKILKFIDGITVLNNAAVFKDKVYFSKPALQIKSNSILSSLPAATGGRQWPVVLKPDQSEKINRITYRVGRIMSRNGYRGFFGLDFIIGSENGKVYLSENNARLTASSSLYTKLETEKNIFPLLGYHLLSFLPDCVPENEVDYNAPEIFGSEIVCRNNEQYNVKITENLCPGMYNADLSFIKESYFLDSDQNDVFWFTSAAKNRIVSPETEIFKTNFRSAACDKSGELFDDRKILLKSLKEKLKIVKND